MFSQEQLLHEFAGTQYLSYMGFLDLCEISKFSSRRIHRGICLHQNINWYYYQIFYNTRVIQNPLVLAQFRLCLRNSNREQDNLKGRRQTWYNPFPGYLSYVTNSHCSSDIQATTWWFIMAYKSGWQLELILIAHYKFYITREGDISGSF